VNALWKARTLAVRAGTAGEAAAANAAAERMLARLRSEISFCREHRRLLGNRERQFLDRMSNLREPTPRDATMTAAIAAAIRKDPRFVG
jgi:hypothetical protein